MDMGAFVSVIKRLGQAIKLFFEIVGIIQIVLGIGGGVVTGAGVIASLQKLPIIIPIAVLVIGVGLLAYATMRTIHRYRQWNNLAGVPDLNNVMAKALDIHIHISELHDIVVKQNKGKRIKTKVREALAEKFLETLQIPRIELARGTNPDGTMKKKLYRKIRKLFHLKQGDYFTALPLLKGYGHLLDRSKLGLRDSIRADTEYDRLRNDFMKSQIGLNVPSDIIDAINTLPELSYGLNSVSVGLHLINEGRSWYKYVPDGYIQQKGESRERIDTAYLTATMWVKNKVRREMFREAVK